MKKWRNENDIIEKVIWDGSKQFIGDEVIDKNYDDGAVKGQV